MSSVGRGQSARRTFLFIFATPPTPGGSPPPAAPSPPRPPFPPPFPPPPSSPSRTAPGPSHERGIRQPDGPRDEGHVPRRIGRAATAMANPILRWTGREGNDRVDVLRRGPAPTTTLFPARISPPEGIRAISTIFSVSASRPRPPCRRRAPPRRAHEGESPLPEDLDVSSTRGRRTSGCSSPAREHRRGGGHHHGREHVVAMPPGSSRGYSRWPGRSSGGSPVARGRCARSRTRDEVEQIGVDRFSSKGSAG